MKKNYKLNTLVLLILASFIMCISCNSWKKGIASDGNFDTIVHNCITDFIHTKLCSQYSVFEIYEDSISPDIYKIVIAPEVDKFFPHIRDSIGLAYNATIPTRYAIINNKLFLWKDSTAPITSQLMDVYNRFNAIDNDWRNREVNIPLGIKDGDIPENRYIPPAIYHDDIPCASYFICKDNLSIYVREIEIWYIDSVPKSLKCN